MKFACLQHLDMINLRLGLGEFYLIFTGTAETLLDGFSCLTYDAAPPTVDSTIKILFYGCEKLSFQMKN